ncbi:MAG: hypothetical protein H7067_11960 [Burkholderiales bacterium]|nr:hypothetical protein [Opitutaceae bacterium]
MNTHTLVTLFALLLVGAGCRSVGNARVAATKGVLASGDATLELNLRRPSESTAHFYVALIDGPKGRQELALSPVEGFYRVQPGINTLTIKTLAYDITAPDADSEAATAILVFAAAPGVAYTLNGFDDGKTLTLYVTERNTLQPVTAEVNVPITKPVPLSEPHTIPIPILIPLL